MKHLTDISKGLKSVRYGTALHPSRDWLVLLACAFVGILASIAWNLWTFTKVTEGEPIGTEALSPAADRAPVDAVTKLFEKRAAEEARYRNEYRFVDPSTTSR